MLHAQGHDRRAELPAPRPFLLPGGTAPPTAARQQDLARAALQRAFRGVKAGAPVYLPAGAYRVTRPLELTGPLLGVLVVGHGRDTVLVWDGPDGGELFVVDGVAYSRYVGIAFDGRGKAAVG